MEASGAAGDHRFCYHRREFRLFSCRRRLLAPSQLQALIREQFDVSLRLIDLLETSGLREMASMIENTSPVGMIDWETETEVDRSLVSVELPEKSLSGKTTVFNVIMTGSTGYLGRHILQELVADDRVSTIHCVAIRQLDGDGTQRVPNRSPKLRLYSGNLMEPMLGLSGADFTKLIDQANTIIHCGASRSFWDYYQALRMPNFWSTKELIRMAVSRKIPIHFISSSGVLSPADGQSCECEPASASRLQPPTDGSLGYIASKWASEVYLEKVSNAFGIPVHIHRATGTPLKQQPPIDVMRDMSNITSRLKILPDDDGWDGTFDVARARDLARTIYDHALLSATRDGLVPKLLHHPPDSVYTCRKLWNCSMSRETLHPFTSFHCTRGRVRRSAWAWNGTSQRWIWLSAIRTRITVVYP